MRGPAVAPRATGVALALALLVSGCARPPAPGTPLAPGELEEIAASLESTTRALEGARGAGSGDVRFGRRGAPFSFAVVYSRPGWLRIDLRPELGLAEASLTTLGVVDGGCARLYVPGRMLEVRDCFAAPMLDEGGFDLGGLLMGAPGAAFLRKLDEPRVRPADDRRVVSGRLTGAMVAATIADGGALLELEIAGSDGAKIALVYSGHRDVGGALLPRRVEGVVSDGGGREVDFDIRYRSLKPDRSIERKQYEFVVPEGVRVIGWDDLSLWRES